MNSEDFAKACVEGLATHMHLLPVVNQSQGQHDFDLEMDGTVVGAMEVASLIDSDFTSMTAALYGRRGHGERVRRMRCRQCWHVTTSSGASIVRIHDELDACLSQLEAAGLTKFGRTSRDPSAQTIRHRLGLASGRVVETSDPSGHWIGLPILSGWLDPSLVNAAVVEVASRPDNRRKLSNISYLERHLFVFVDTSSAEVWSVLTSPEFDIGLAPEPFGPTHLWVGAHTARASEAVVLRAQAGQCWERHRLPM